MPNKPGVAPGSPTTRLGDWYANVLFCRPQHLILCVSERTLLPLVIPAKPLASLEQRLPLAISELLTAFDIAPDQVNTELRAMQPVAYGPTANRRLLGTHNDLMYLLSVAIEDHPHESLLTRSLWLADTPCKPIGFSSPMRQTIELFASTTSRGNPLH